MSEDISEKEAKEILRQFSEGKQNVHSFFTNVIKSKDTTKVGNLKEEELGLPKLPLRTYKELELFCDDVYSDTSWASYFKRMGEIITSTSLSKEALLLRLSVTEKKEMADKTPMTRKKNAGWFKKKDERRQN
ncbi:MAG: hypothetical protein ACOC3V_01350 [bacterium]